MRAITREEAVLAEELPQPGQSVGFYSQDLTGRDRRAPQPAPAVVKSTTSWYSLRFQIKVDAVADIETDRSISDMAAQFRAFRKGVRSRGPMIDVELPADL